MTGYAENSLVRGLSFLAEKQATIANNLANVNTTGFKRSTAVAQDAPGAFHSMLDERLAAVDFVERRDLGVGTIRDTGNRLDVALEGRQWLQVQDQDGGQFYTRNGQLRISADGKLVTGDDLELLDTTGRAIVVNAGGNAPSDLVISPNGTITNPETNAQIGRLALVELPDPDALQPVGRGLYRDPADQQATQAAQGLRQGALEGSNVDSLQELVAMITVERSFAATQRALKGVNQLQENMITQMLR
ncbi:MAG: flagellar hook-basal body protein [Planctomycetota bacterium]